MSLPPLVPPVAAISDAERARTARHTALRGLGELGQRRLAGARVAIVGLGGLGSPVLLALAAAGIGELVVIDDDAVESSNLQRQVLHRMGDVGAPKTSSAVRAAADLAPETTVVEVRERLTPENAAALLTGVDVVVDGTDTFETREAVAAACESLGVPLVWGVIQGTDAQVTVFWSAPPPGVAPVVLGDLHPTGSVGAVPTCAEVGVLGALCLQVGGMLATEVIKLVTGIGEPLLGRIVVIDGLAARQREVPLRGRRAGAGSTAARRSGADASTAPPRARRAAPAVELVDLAGLRAAAAAGAVLLDVREPEEHATGMLPGALARPLAGVLDDPAALGAGPFVVICAAGVRATRAAEALIAVGARAVVLEGGLRAVADEARSA